MYFSTRGIIYKELVSHKKYYTYKFRTYYQPFSIPFNDYSHIKKCKMFGKIIYEMKMPWPVSLFNI